MCAPSAGMVGDDQRPAINYSDARVTDGHADAGIAAAALPASLAASGLHPALLGLARLLAREVAANLAREGIAKVST